MPTCPNCGSIVMEGDPYCSHCGAHFKWNFTVEEEDSYDENVSSSHYAPSPAYDVGRDYEKPNDFLDYGEVGFSIVEYWYNAQICTL